MESTEMIEAAITRIHALREHVSHGPWESVDPGDVYAEEYFGSPTVATSADLVGPAGGGKASLFEDGSDTSEHGGMRNPADAAFIATMCRPAVVDAVLALLHAGLDDLRHARPTGLTQRAIDASAAILGRLPAF